MVVINLVLISECDHIMPLMKETTAFALKVAKSAFESLPLDKVLLHQEVANMLI